MKHIDKNSLKHFAACFIPSLFGLYGASFAAGAAITKEYFDKQVGGHWCWWDLLADLIGIIVGGAIHLLIFGTIYCF